MEQLGITGVEDPGVRGECVYVRMTEPEGLPPCGCMAVKLGTDCWSVDWE